MKRFLLIIVVGYTFFVQGANGQSDFRKGYIITQGYDTIIGEINNGNYYDNSQFCDFRKIKTDSIIRYYPDKLVGYRFTEGKYYISKEVKSKRVFLEYLINGKLNIYFYQDESMSNHYYASKDSSSIQELKYSIGIKKFDGKQIFYESKPYAGLLTYYTSDCPAIKGEISSINEPSHKNLINFAKEYHNLTCNDEKCIIYEKKNARKIKFLMEGGANFFLRKVLEIDQERALSYGFKILFQQSYNSERIYLGIGIVNEGKIDSLNHHLIRIPLSINYIHPKQGFSPFFAYEFDLNSFGLCQALKIGVNCKFSKVSLFINGSVKTALFLMPYFVSGNCGIMFDLI